MTVTPKYPRPEKLSPNLVAFIEYLKGGTYTQEDLAKALGYSPKKCNSRMSLAAFELQRTLPEEDWLRETRNEHQEQLRCVWSWIRENNQITRDEVLARFRRWPMITVTAEEDASLRHHTDVCDPAERYRAAGISVGKKVNGSWQPLQPSGS